MGRYIIIGIISYLVVLGGMYLGHYIGGIVGDIIFWILFILSTWIIFRIIQMIRTFFTDIYAANKAQKKEVKEYVEKVMKEHNTSISITDKF
jgi:uncharacterized Tic20 family protein